MAYHNVVHIGCSCIFHGSHYPVGLDFRSLGFAPVSDCYVFVPVSISQNNLYSVLVMFPIINIPVYIAAIRRSEQQVPLGYAAKLYMQGRLAPYLIQIDYSSLIKDGNGQ